MKTWLRLLLTLAMLSFVLLRPRLASAQVADAGVDGGCVDYAGNPCPPLACDGALCDTTNGSGCSVAAGSGNSTLPLFVISAVALAIARRHRRRQAEQPR
jgi:MYXO-CTERM domain-containing protein